MNLLLNTFNHESIIYQTDWSDEGKLNNAFYVMFLYSFTKGDDNIRSLEHKDRTNRPMLKDKDRCKPL